MPRLTLLLERKPLQVYDLDQDVIRIGRSAGLEIVIDNVSVSRRQAEIWQDGGTWKIADLGSENGTLLNGQRLTEPQPLRPGDEISFGKYSLFFERTFDEPGPRNTPAPAASPEEDRTFQLRPEDLQRLQRAAALKRRAQIEWRVKDQRGTHYIDAGGAIVGRSALCDLQVPAGGPPQHLVIMRGPSGFEIRNLSRWYRMRVNGEVTTRAALKSGDVIEVGFLRLTFLDEVH
jgi:pSer/pThr/pTyr-binding forkhead associated (FHA) protein